MSCMRRIVLFLAFGAAVQFCGTARALKQVASQVDAASAAYPALAVYFNYNSANSPKVAFPDRIRVFLAFRDTKLLDRGDRIVAEVKLTDLGDSSKAATLFLPVSIDEESAGAYQNARFDISNAGQAEPIVQPGRVYRLFVNLHRQADSYGAGSVIGRVRGVYYVATSGATPIQRARQQIVMRTFKEYYYRKCGWRSGERYPMDCYAYYMWATGFCTVGAENGRTRLHRLFGGRFPYQNGAQIPGLSRREPIHGDYVRKPGHSFMLLAYDRRRGHVWCMEGNFNNTIEVVVRSVSSDWKVGHLVAEHIRPGLFEARPES